MKLTIARTYLTLSACGLLSGCASMSDMKNAQSDIGAARDQIIRLEDRCQKTETKLDSFKGLSADVEAVRTYFLDVKNTVKLMRDDTVKILDDQRVAIDQSRKNYLKILRSQQEMLDKLIKDMDKFLAETDPSLTKEPVPPVKLEPPPATAPAQPVTPADNKPKALPAGGGLPSGLQPEDSQK